MAEVEIGTFLALNAIAFAGWILTAKWGWGIMLILSFVVFGGLSLFMFAELQVVQTTTISDESDGSVDTFSYDVQSSTGQVLINNVSSQTQAELASSSSSLLVGDVIDCMTVWLGKAGSPPASDITFAVFNTNNEVVKLFGTQQPNDMASSALTPYTHCLAVGQTHTILNGQYIGVNYDDGDGSNTITMRVDGNNPFDGTVTYRAQYTSSWGSSTGQDIMMQMYLRGAAGTEVVSTEKVAYIDSQQNTFGWVYFILTGLTMTWFVKVIMNMFKARNRVTPAGYY